LAADTLQMGVSTIRRVMADYRREPLLLNKPPKPKGCPNYSIDNSHEEIIRNFIQNANKNGQYITTSIIYDLILEREPKANFHRAALTGGLDCWGFEFGIGARLNL
jgi:transposase